MTAKKQTVNPDKTLDGPMIMTGSHEPLSFRRRTGNAGVGEEEYWQREHSEEVVAGLARRGVTWVRTHYYKGNGLKAEADEIEMTRRFVRLCHRYGIKVQLYTQFGTLQYETLLAEDPNMRNWACVNEQGEMVTIRYGHQGFRFKPCLVREGYWKYYRKVLKKAVEDIKGDGLGFDNVEGPMEPDSCHCPECRTAFTRYLKKKYSVHTAAGRKRAEERFGFFLLDHITPPVFNKLNPPITCTIIKDPVMQEWMEFRCENLRKRMEEIWDFVKSLNPGMMIEYNVYPPCGKNGPYWQGIDMHRLGRHLNLFYNERGPEPPLYNNEGRFWHRVHSMKLAEANGAESVIVGNRCADPDLSEICLSEALAFNRGHITQLGRRTEFADGAFPEADPFIVFRHAHPELYEETESACDVGLFESSATLANNSIRPHLVWILAMNGLMSGHMPFDSVIELVPEKIKRYAVLVLPDTECMSDPECRVLTDYVKNGGGAVLIADASRFDSARRRRPEPGLAGMLKRAENYSDVSALKPGASMRGTFGRGRFVYLKNLSTVAPFHDFEHCVDGPNIHPEAWRVPSNQAAFAGAIKWASSGRRMVSVTGPQGLAAEARKTGDGRLIVHLVNYRADRTAKSTGLQIASKEYGSARMWDPHSKKSKKLEIRKSGGKLRVTVGNVRRYAVIEIS